MLGLVREMEEGEVDLVRDKFIKEVRGDWEKYCDNKMCFLNAVPKWVRDEGIKMAALEFEKENGNAK